jgi:hypothetical protein
VEAWFKTTTRTGGKIIGFGKRRHRLEQNYDRHIYLDNAGRCASASGPAPRASSATATAYNDGAAPVVGTLGPQGLNLFVDGAPAGPTRRPTTAQSYKGLLAGWW